MRISWENENDEIQTFGFQNKIMGYNYILQIYDLETFTIQWQ